MEDDDDDEDDVDDDEEYDESVEGVAGCEVGDNRQVLHVPSDSDSLISSLL